MDTMKVRPVVAAAFQRSIETCADPAEIAQIQRVYRNQLMKGNGMAAIKINISCDCDPDSQCANVFRTMSTICEYDSESDIIVKFTFDRMELLIKNARLEECEDAAGYWNMPVRFLKKRGVLFLSTLKNIQEYTIQHFGCGNTTVHFSRPLAEKSVRQHLRIHPTVENRRELYVQNDK